MLNTKITRTSAFSFFPSFSAAVNCHELQTPRKILTTNTNTNRSRNTNQKFQSRQNCFFPYKESKFQTATSDAAFILRLNHTMNPTDTIAAFSKAMKRKQSTMPHPANPPNKLQLNVNKPHCLNSYWKRKHMDCTPAALNYPAVPTPLHIRKHAVTID